MRIRLAPVLSALSFAYALASPFPALAAGPYEKLEEFDMEQVRVTDPYYQQLFQVDVDYLLRLDPDRLMAGFNAVSLGQNPASGVTLYGGWEGGWSLLRGHTLGHYLTALAQAYRQTAGTDPATQQEVADVLDHMMSELKTFQDRSSNGYLFASPETHFDVVEGKVAGDMWVPWYTMHKIMSGLIDVYELQGNPTALDIASTLGDWVYERTSTWDAGTRTKVLGVEYGGMNDCLYELYKHTNDPNHLTAAHRFDEDTLFSPIADGDNVLPNKHANTQIPKFIGSLNRYRVLGESEAFYRTAAEQFWTIVLRDHTYVTGGNSENEHFRTPGALDAQRNEINNETCNAYNMLKLTRELFKISGDVKYADFYERAFINEILSAINPETGMTAYFKPMGTGYFKAFGSETDTFWCCNGTGMENYTKLNDGIYYHDAEDLYVNLYISSTVAWTAKSLQLSQSADVPLSSKVTFAVGAAPGEEVGIKFRKPYWLAADELAIIKVNGVVQCVQAVDGYFEVSRIWTAGDEIELVLPSEVRVSRLPDNENAVAFTYGPVVLSAGLGNEQMVTTGHLASVKATIPEGLTIKDTISVTAGTIEDFIANIRDNLVQSPGSLEFTLRNTDEDDQLRFTPQYLRYEDRYGIYFELQGEQGTPPPPAEPLDQSWTNCDGAGEGAAGGTGGTGGAGGSGGAVGGAAGGAGVAGSGATHQGGSAPLLDQPGSEGLAPSNDQGCGCRIPGKRAPVTPLGAIAALALLAGTYGRNRARKQIGPSPEKTLS